jgi:hypothetical protein
LESFPNYDWQRLREARQSGMPRLAQEGPATTAGLARAESMKPQPMGTTVAARTGL